MMELLISWCVTSSILLAVFLLLRGTLFRKLSPGMRYALWGVVLLRLLVPFQMPDLSLPAAAVDLAPEPPILSSRPLSPDTAAGHGVIPSDQLEVNGLTIADDGTVQTSRPGQDTALWELQENGEVYMYFGGPTLDDVIHTAVVLVWGTGCGAVLLAVLVSNLLLARRLRRSRVPLPETEAPLPVYQGGNLPSPCLFGVFFPAIYVTPELAGDPAALVHVLAHECTHFRHRDHIWSLLRCLALALHWYNPLVWAAVVLSKGDGELACDAGTVAQLGEEERLPYGRTLVALAARSAGHGGRFLSCSTTMTEGKKSIQKRVLQLVKQPEAKKTALFLAAAAVALAAVFVFASGNTETSLALQLQEATVLRLSFGNYSSYAPPPLTDADLVAQAKGFLLSGDLQDHTVVPGRMFSGSYVELLDGEGRSLGLHFLSNQSMCTSLYELAREQEARDQSQTTYQVEHPVFKAQLTELFLNDPECVAQNQSPDSDMADWLTSWTTFYDVSYGVPWWDPTAPEGWYARANDAGSWYSIAIPDHLADAVLEVCRQSARYPLQSEYGQLLENAVSVTLPSGEEITSASHANNLAQFFRGLPFPSTDQGQLTLDAAGLRPYVFRASGGQQIALYLQASDQGCLLAAAPSDGAAGETLPAMALLPAATLEQVEQISQNALAGSGRVQSILSAMASLQGEDIQQVIFVGGPTPDSWAESLDREELAQLVREAAGQPQAPLELPFAPSDESSLDYALWSLELWLTDGTTLSLYAGRAEDQVSITETTHLTSCSQLYELIRHAADGAQGVAVTDPAILEVMDQVAADTLELWRTPEYAGEFTDNCQDVQLTALYPLEPLGSLGEGVELYGYDLGFVMEDLFNAPWAGGPFVDSQLRYHPYGIYYLVVERAQDGTISRWGSFLHSFDSYRPPFDGWPADLRAQFAASAANALEAGGVWNHSL